MIKSNNLSIIHTCSNCSRKYKNKTNYDKHKLICNVMCKTIKERERENENIDDTPNIRELYSIILHLSNKCEIMERKIEKLNGIYNKDKKKINVLEWLNTNKMYSEEDGDKEIQVFSEWIKTVNISENDMNYVVEHTFLDGLKYIIKKLLRENGEYNIYCPIRAFEQKDNLFYIYDYVNTGTDNYDINGEKRWMIMSPEKLNELFTKITKGFITQLRIWKDKNIHRISEDGFTHIYANNIKKLTGGELSIQQQQIKFRKYLYNDIKINIKSLIEYEYEF